MTSPGTSNAGTASVQEFKIRVPKNVKKKYHVMRFNATLNVDFAKWSHVKMERENNIKEFKGIDEDMPKFGAGSEYGRDMREEARRKKFGITSRKYKPEDQPWILKVGGKTGKKFKGIREGGVSENAAYYVFTHAADGAIDAYPLQEWYNFQPIQRYKALSAEEAEQEFGRRNKVLNYFSLMFRKRMRGDDGVDDVDDPDDKKPKGAKTKKDLKISEMDEWIDSDDDSSSSEKEEKDNESDSGANKKKKDKKAATNKKKKKVEDEAFEESDDGDEEGREKDYISDSSDSESDHETKANKELKGVAEEDALRKLLTSDEDSEDSEKEHKEQEEEQEDEPTKEGEERASKLIKKKKKSDDNKKDSSSEFSSDSDTDPENSSSKKPKKSKNGPEKNGPSTSASGSANTSRSGTPTPSAAAAAVAAANAANSNLPPAKRPKLEPAYTECGVTEEAVRRYLARKPMTTTELLTKFKSKRTGVSSDRLVETMTQILKRINPDKRNINGKMYLSIKNHETKANKELKGVAEEDALRKLLTSDEDSEDSEKEHKEQEEEQEDEPTKEGEERASKLIKKKKKSDDNKKDSSSEFSSDSDTDPENSSSKKPKKSKNGPEKNGPSTSASGSANTSRSGTPTPSAAAAAVAAANAANSNLPPAKRPKLEPAYTECGVTEEAVRRYLARKPMTTTELLTKFKSKRTGVSSDRLVETMTQILKRINPDKRNINGKMYLSIKNHETKANKELKGVAEEDALRKLLTSDEDSEDSEKEHKEQEEEQEDEPTKEGEERASKLIKKKKKSDDNKKDSSSEFSSDSDTDPENSSSKKPKKSKNGPEKNGPSTSASGSANTSRSGTPTPSAAAAAVAAANAANSNLPPAKRPKLEPAYTECGVTEEAVRRYLARKPMTTTELLTKFKSKRTGVSSDRLVETMTQILKRINPDKRNINGKMYLSIKST